MKTCNLGFTEERRLENWLVLVGIKYILLE